jgi:hypothetical protein
MEGYIQWGSYYLDLDTPGNHQPSQPRTTKGILLFVASDYLRMSKVDQTSDSLVGGPTENLVGTLLLQVYLAQRYTH